MANCQICHLLLTISLDLTKSSEVRKVGDRSNSTAILGCSHTAQISFKNMTR